MRRTLLLFALALTMAQGCAHTPSANRGVYQESYDGEVWIDLVGVSYGLSLMMAGGGTALMVSGDTTGGLAGAALFTGAILLILGPYMLDDLTGGDESWPEDTPR